MVAVDLFAEAMSLLCEHVRLSRNQSREKREHKNSCDRERCTAHTPTIMGLHIVGPPSEIFSVRSNRHDGAWHMGSVSPDQWLYHPDFLEICQENRRNHFRWRAEVTTTPHRSPEETKCRTRENGLAANLFGTALLRRLLCRLLQRG